MKYKEKDTNISNVTGKHICNEEGQGMAYQVGCTANGIMSRKHSLKSQESTAVVGNHVTIQPLACHVHTLQA